MSSSFCSFVNIFLLRSRANLAEKGVVWQPDAGDGTGWRDPLLSLLIPESGLAGTKNSSPQRWLSGRRIFNWPGIAPIWTEEGAHKGRLYAAAGQAKRATTEVIDKMAPRRRRSGLGVGGPVDFLQMLDGDMGVALSGGEALVSQEFLNRAKVGAVVEQMRGERMAQQVRMDVQ